MKVWELLKFLECPKSYDLDAVILHSENRRDFVFQKALDILKSYFLQKRPWDDFSDTLRNFLVDSYESSWYEVNWQKRSFIEDELFRFKRLYYWLQTNIKGKLSVNKEFQMHYSDMIYERSISMLQISSDLFIEQADGSITGVLLRRKFENRRSFSRKYMTSDLELLILMQCLIKAYPEEKIQVIRVCTTSIRDTKDTFAVFEETPGDNTISFSREEYLAEVGSNCEDVLKTAIQKRKLKSCNHCRYERICLPFTNRHLKSEALKPERPCKITYTEVQERAIMHRNGPMRVCAGPGAGKTESLVARIKYLMESGVNPEKILAVTFTRKAAKEILDRIQGGNKPKVETLHALGFSIVRMSEGLIGKKKLVSRVDCMEMLRKTLQQAPIIRGIRHMQLMGKNGLLEKLFLDFAFIEKYGAAQFITCYPEKDAKGIFLVKEMYDQRFKRAGYIMFEDQIRLAVKVLEQFSVVRESVQDTYEYILVDEAQDLDEMQIRFIRLLVKQPGNNIAIYGDIDQSIYGFRGSSHRFMLEFLKLYPNAADVRLDINFRSSDGIFLAANKLIEHNTERVDLKSRTIHKGESKPVLIQDFNPNQIGNFVNQIRKSGYALEDIAVIARTNKELGSIGILFDKFNEEHPDSENIKYEKPKYYMYLDFVFRILLDLLEIYHKNYGDDMVWYRLIGTHEIMPAKKDTSHCIYKDYVDRKLIYAFDEEEALCYLSLTERDEEILRTFAKIYRTIQYFQLPLCRAIPKVIETYVDPQIESSEIIEMLNDMIRERRIRNATELWKHMKAMVQYEDETRITYENLQSSKIHLLTAHDSKGKEFPVVLVYGVDDFESGNQQEDRRLLYVAMTRAKEQLYLTEHCKGRSFMIKELGDSVELWRGGSYA